MGTKAPSAGAWTAVHRRKLTAIRAPHAKDPKDFFFDAESAAANLSTVGPVPDTLTVETERARAYDLAQSRGVSWSDAKGRCFTDEYWNPLVALWVYRGGWDLVFDLMIPDPKAPAKTELRQLSSPHAVYCAVRRYLWRAEEREFAKARARVAPVVAWARSEGTYDDRKTAALLAFAFDRDPAWVLEAMSAYAAEKKQVAIFTELFSVCPDVELSLRVRAKLNNLREVFHVYDAVETLGHRALPLLATWTPDGAANKKHVATAVGIAESLAP